jgi:hypothetical protein
MLDDRTVGARRDIAADEELTLDYALITVSPEWRMQSPRERVVPRCGDRQRLASAGALQQRYTGHFSSFINARIAARRR